MTWNSWNRKPMRSGYTVFFLWAFKTSEAGWRLPGLRQFMARKITYWQWSVASPVYYTVVLIEDENIAFPSNKNRHFMKVEIGGDDYVALYDPGSEITIVGPRIAEKFKWCIEESASYIKAPVASKPLNKTMGYLGVNVEN